MTDRKRPRDVPDVSEIDMSQTVVRRGPVSLGAHAARPDPSPCPGPPPRFSTGNAPVPLASATGLRTCQPMTDARGAEAADGIEVASPPPAFTLPSLSPEARRLPRRSRSRRPIRQPFEPHLPGGGASGQQQPSLSTARSESRDAGPAPSASDCPAQSTQEARREWESAAKAFFEFIDSRDLKTTKTMHSSDTSGAMGPGVPGAPSADE